MHQGMAIVSTVCGNLSEETIEWFETENAVEFPDVDNPGKKRQISIVGIAVVSRQKIRIYLNDHQG